MATMPVIMKQKVMHINVSNGYGKERQQSKALLVKEIQDGQGRTNGIQKKLSTCHDQMSEHNELK